MRPVLRAALLLLSLQIGLAAPALPEWKDPKGAVFRGEPAEVVGPLALFRTGAATSRFLPLRALPPDDILRFHAAIAERPARAARWSEAQGAATRELVGRLIRLENRSAKPVDLSALPEPELLFVAFRAAATGSTWRLFDNLAPFLTRIQRVYPGRTAAVIVNQGRTELDLPPGRHWLQADPKRAGEMKLLGRFSPGAGTALILMTREGVPLLGAPVNDLAEITAFVDRASELLWQINPANPRTAADRSHYLKLVRPRQFAAAAAEPLLIAEMFKAEGLRRYGVEAIEARIDVADTGAVAAVELLPESRLPAELRPTIAGAIRQLALFAPAIDQGRPVAGRYDYRFRVGPPEPQLAADAAWVNGEARAELPFKSWLVLKPVRVPEQVFSGIERVGADGTYIMQAVTAGEAGKISVAAQKNSFNQDWFAEAGAASVRPRAGDRQEVDGKKLTWRKLVPEHGLIDLLEGDGHDAHNYSIGYAWTEIEVAADTDAWLGIGSDDGLRIWLNGDLVNDRWVQRTSRLDDDVVPLRLKQGANTFLIKIQNMKGQWSFTARLRVRSP